jgi:hypothetical protein
MKNKIVHVHPLCNFLQKNRKAAIEMSMGTIIVIVLSISLLIFGMIFVRSVMCSGIIMTEEISSNVQNEIRGLFGANDYGVKCLGEGSEEKSIGDGGRRKIICMIKSEEGGQYSLQLKEIKSLAGISTENIQSWIIDSGFDGNVGVGESTQSVVTLNIPKNTPTTTIKIIIEETNPLGMQKTHISILDVKHVGTFTTAIC